MKKNEKNKQKWIAIFIIAFLILAAVIFAVVLGKNNKGNTTETGSDASSSATTENSEKDNSEAETKENTYYWLITDKKTGITVDSEGWTDAKDYNGVSWAKAPTEKLAFVWCYATDPDGKVVIEPTLWYEFQADSSTATSTETASSEKPTTETSTTDSSNSGCDGNGNNSGSNTGSTGNNGSTGGNTGNTGSTGNNGGSTTPSYHPTTSTTTEDYEGEWTTVEPTSSTTEQQTTTHTHSFELVVTEEKGEYKEVVVQEGYWKPVKIGSYNQCNGCGINLSNMSEESMTAHLLRCTGDGTSYHLEPIWGEEWVEPVTETKWVVTEPSKHYLQCSVCGYIDN